MASVDIRAFECLANGCEDAFWSLEDQAYLWGCHYLLVSGLIWYAVALLYKQMAILGVRRSPLRIK